MASANTVPFEPHSAINNPLRLIAPATRFGSATLGQPIGYTMEEFARGFSCATSGNVTFVKYDGTVQQVYLLAGMIHPICFKQINETVSSPATGLIWYS